MKAAPMTAWNYAQITTIGLMMIAASIATLLDIKMPTSSAICLGWGIAWIGLNLLPKLYN
jgi:hypothetical protein